MKNYSESQLFEIAKQFKISGSVISCGPFGEGHINSTYVVETDCARYVLQLINTGIFSNPDELMQNICNVTEYLSEIINNAGGDPLRETMNVISTLDGRSFYKTEDGDVFRCYLFVENTICYQSIANNKDFFNCGVAFGNFQKLLADFPAEKLHETIKNFHNTEDRYRLFELAVAEDRVGRAASVAAEIEFAKKRKNEACVLVNALRAGEIPFRVTHNDTKLNNILFDDKSGECICVIDLDTVMPGAAAYDFGDCIRFGASTAAEDETDLSKVEMSIELFDVFAKGYMQVSSEFLTDKEVESLSIGAKIMTLECGVRFLTDYLNGDTYFRIHRPNHNLDRCRTQFKLVADMENKMDDMQRIVKGYR